MSDDRGVTTPTPIKPYNMMTPAERTAIRIAQNRAIREKIADSQLQRAPAASTAGFTRATPDEQSKVSGVIRKVRAK